MFFRVTVMESLSVTMKFKSNFHVKKSEKQHLARRHFNIGQVISCVSVISLESGVWDQSGDSVPPCHILHQASRHIHSDGLFPLHWYQFGKKKNKTFGGRNQWMTLCLCSGRFIEGYVTQVWRISVWTSGLVWTVRLETLLFLRFSSPFTSSECLWTDPGVSSVMNVGSTSFRKRCSRIQKRLFVFTCRNQLFL